MIPYKIFSPFILLLLLVGSVKAQLTANFTVDKSSGCSPLSVSFVNKTTGASSSAIYTWDFGNSSTPITTTNIADTEHAIYNNQQTYTITLSVSDNGKQSQKQLTITVFPNPTPSFEVSDSIGCTPLQISFTSTSIAGAGSINKYFFDFGDGHSISSDTPNVSHIYKVSGKFSPLLTVATTNGCTSNSFEKQNFINALLTPIAAYNKNKAFLCQVGDSVSFENNSTNLQQSTYKWSFGDGSFSIDSTPTHTYNTKGVFNDTLIVKNIDGCVDTATSTLYSSLFRSNDTATGLCAQQNIVFKNTSVPTPDSSLWSFSNNPIPFDSINAINKFDVVGTYNVQLINSFGTCRDTITKSIVITPAISLSGFSVTTSPLCGIESMVSVIDTSAGGAAWLWSIGGIKDSLKTDTAQFTLLDNQTYTISLSTTKTSGCTTATSKTIRLTKTPVIIVTNTGDSLNKTSGCQGMTVAFSATPPNGIKTYSWDFGDNSTSTDSAPSHQYNTAGNFHVQLIYTTADGCKDTIGAAIRVFLKPVVTFYTPDTVNCGSKAYFYNTTKTPSTKWFWYFSDTSLINNLENPWHAFRDTGTFSVKLIVYNGSCYDSAVYKNYIRILAPLLHIDTVAYTCNGNRDTANFLVTNAYVQGKLTLTFGDGDSTIFNPVKGIDTIVHRYLGGTGTYRSVLTGTNGGCTVRDTDWVHILIPQHPKLSANKLSVCENDTVKLFIDTTTLQPNPGVSDSNYYSVYQWQYGGAANIFNYSLASFTSLGDWYHNYLGTLTGLKPGETQLRVILQSGYFGCYDTTQPYLSLRVKGPQVGYYISNPDTCFRKPLLFIDTTKSTTPGVSLATWEWNFGDSTYDTLTISGNVKHYFKTPGIYGTYLKVIDQEGCFGISSIPDSAMPSGPKASFIWNPPYIVSGTSADFINTTNKFEDNIVNYQWSFSSNGFKATTTDVKQIFYPTTLTDTVMLIATAPATGCTDTAINLVPVKKVFALFGYTLTYLNNGCAPVLVNLTSNSINADKLRWDFGDGSPGSGIGNDTIVSHTYNLPGVYIIKLYAYKNGNITDIATDTLTVKGAYATVLSNITMACVPATVTFSSLQTNAISSYWDYGDGKSDTFSLHRYTQPGNFAPRVILTDINGCQSSFTSTNKVLIDSLHASFKTNLTPICDSATVKFIPKIWSYSHDTLGYALKYHWTFGTGNTKDTSNLASPTFYFRLGTYPVIDSLKSVAGCSFAFDSSISVVQSVRATIAAPAKVCDSTPISFSGNIIAKDTAIATTDTVQWKWYFDNGVTSSLQNPDSIYYTSPADVVSNKKVMLITTFNGCHDTTNAAIVVNPSPVVNLQPRDQRICEGLPITLTANDGNSYRWKPGSFSSKLSSITVKPDTTKTYQVAVTNSYKCTSIDTTTVLVTQHLALKYHDMNVCKGQSVQLPVSGTDNIVWTPDATLTNAVSNPLSPTATPVVDPTVYHFKAKDDYGCFDSVPGAISVAIQPYPSISTDSALRVFTGDSVQLKTYPSSDVVSYAWSPGTYLDCDTCPMPYSTPRENIAYTVTGTTQYGCASSAEVTVTIICSKAIYFPNVFTPDAQSNNIFYPRGKGIKTISRFQIFNRSGEVLYSVSNMPVGFEYLGYGWNGNLNGIKQPSGTYVYTAEAICDTGVPFPLSGTIVLIR